MCYFKTQQENEAVEHLKQAVLTGRSEKSFSELAELYERQKDHTSAINAYKDALRWTFFHIFTLQTLAT